MPEARPSFILAVASLWRREMVRFIRQRSRIVGALGTPVIFWFLIGSGIGRSFGSEGDSGYLGFFFPGTLVLILLFTSVFSAISIIEDRQAGFLQGVLAAPIPRSAIVCGQVLGATTLAWGQALLFLLLAPAAGYSLDLRKWLVLLPVMALVSFGMSAMGFLLAWRCKTTQGFHSLMNLMLLPMWFLSGALFPVEGASFWIRIAMKINPLTYGLMAIRQCLAGTVPTVSLAVFTGFSVLIFLAALKGVGGRRIT